MRISVTALSNIAGLGWRFKMGNSDCEVRWVSIRGISFMSQMLRIWKAELEDDGANNVMTPRWKIYMIRRVFFGAIHLM
jgi:hypothetical protein